MPKLFKMAPHLDDVDGVARSMLRYVEMTEQSCKSLNCLVLAPKSHLFLAQKIWRQDCLPHYMILAILFSLNYIQLLLYYKFLLRSVLLFQASHFLSLGISIRHFNQFRRHYMKFVERKKPKPKSKTVHWIFPRTKWHFVNKVKL